MSEAAGKWSVADRSAGGRRCPVSHFDHHDPDLGEDTVWERYADLAALGPVVWSPAHGGFWVIGGYDEAREATRRPDLFSSAAGHLIPTHGAERSIPIDFDPPLHGEYRDAMAAIMGPAEIAALKPVVRAFLAVRLGALAAAGGGELVGGVALPLPLEVLSRLLELSPQAVARLRPLTEAMWERVGEEDLGLARTDLLELMRTESARARARGEGPIHRLSQATVEGRPLSGEELARMLVTLAVAGHETTMNAVGGLLFELARAPELQDELARRPETIPAVVEESLRLRAPAHGFARTVAAETRLGECALAPGERVLLVYAAANRDGRRFGSPDAFVPGRPERGHLAFGSGSHHCLGARLARMELAALLEVMVELPPFELDGPASFSGLEGGHHLGPRRLPVRFAAAATREARR